MSMRNFGCSGYTVPLFDLIKNFDPAKRDAIIEATNEKDLEEIGELVNSSLPAGFPPVEVFILGDEDESEDLERHVWYAYWDENDLFELKPRPELYALRNSGISPERRNWVVWG